MSKTFSCLNSKFYEIRVRQPGAISLWIATIKPQINNSLVSAPAYRVYIEQLVHYARDCSFCTFEKNPLSLRGEVLDNTNVYVEMSAVSFKNIILVGFPYYDLFIVTVAMLNDWLNHYIVLKLDNLAVVQAKLGKDLHSGFRGEDF